MTDPVGLRPSPGTPTPETPEPPSAPVWFNSMEAYGWDGGWTAGWKAGYRAAALHLSDSAGDAR
jgi:hypothetical protein